MKAGLLGLTVFGAVSALATPALAECQLPKVPLTPNGYFSGQNLIASSDDTLSAYVGGYVNGIMFAIVLGANEDCIRQADKCLATMKGGDMVSALRTYVAADPRRLTQWAATLTFNAIFGECFDTVYGDDPPLVPRPTAS